MHNQQICEDDNSELLMALLTPEAISRTWPDLKVAIESALPPLSNPTQTINRMTGVLESLLTGKLMCHAFYKVIDGQVYSFGIVVTSILHNIEDEQKNLLIYAAYGHSKYITGDHIDMFFSKMKEFAEGQDCKAIVLYSKITDVIEGVKRIGGNADYRLLTLEV